MEPKRILVTGGSGPIGTRLTALLQKRGYDVAHLSRAVSKRKLVQQFIWDIDKGLIEHGAFQGAEVIIHLAGANLAGRRWSNKHKLDILNSRVKGSRLLFEQLAKEKHTVKKFVSSSAIGIYGITDPSKSFLETDDAGDDFLGHVVREWEEEVEHIQTLGITVVRLRLGIVLSAQGGALESIVKTVKANIGAPLGSGDQFVSWVHVDDVCEAFIYAIEQEMEGPYNVVAPGSVTNEELTRKIAAILHKRLWLPHVPAFVLYAILGELARYVVNGNRVLSDKILKAGFVFRFKDIDSALMDLLPSK